MITKEVMCSFAEKITKETGLDAVIYEGINHVWNDNFLVIEITGIEQGRDTVNEFILHYNLHLKCGKFDDDISKIDRLWNKLSRSRFYIERSYTDFNFSTWTLRDMQVLVRRIVKKNKINEIDVEFIYGN